MLQCAIPEGNEGESKAISLIERDLFIVNSVFEITYSEGISIISISPSTIFIRNSQSISTSITVEMTALPSSSTLICVFGTVEVPASSYSEADATIECPSPLFAHTESMSSTSVIMTVKTCNAKVLSASDDADSTLTYLQTPTIMSVAPAYIPRFIEYDPDQVIASENMLYVNGINFSPSLSYSWAFYYGFSLVKEIEAEYIDSNTVRCRPMDFYKQVYLDLKIKADSGSETTFAYGSVRLMLYEPLRIGKIFPKFAVVGQSVELEIDIDELPMVDALSVYYGEVQVTGKIVSWAEAGSKMIKVTVDSVNFYESPNTFTWIPAPIFTGVDNLQLPLTSKKYITVLGSDFTDTGEYLSWRMNFNNSEEIFDLKAEYVSSTEIRCLRPPAYMVPINNVELYISFNRLDYSNFVTDSIEYIDVPSVFSLNKFYGLASVEDTIELKGIGLSTATLVAVSDFATDLVFTTTNDTYGTFTLPAFANISTITNDPYDYLCSFDGSENVKYSNHISNDARAYLVYDEESVQKYRFYITTKDEYGWTCSDRFPRSPIEVGIENLGYSKNGISFQYMPKPEVLYISPESVFKDSPVDLVVTGEGFWNTDDASCRVEFGTTGNYLVVVATYLNSTDIVCPLPAFNDANTYDEMYLYITVSINGNWYVVQDSATVYLTVIEPIVIYAVTPGVIFKYKTDVVIYVLGDPILDEDTLSCRIHEYIISGERVVDGDNVYMKCILPSYEAIVDSATTPIPASGEVSIEISNNGIDYSQQGLMITFLDADQVDGVTPWNGPHTGGTTLSISLKIDQEAGDIGTVLCRFFGTETQEATQSPPDDYLCITPALIAEEDDTEETVYYYDDYALANVEVLIADEVIQEFMFTYNINVTIYSFEPPHGIYDQARTLKIIGENFHPHVNITCKYTLGTEIVMDATYLTNKTISWDVPALDSSYTLPYQLEIELSFNDEHDYTDSGAKYIYCKRNVLSGIHPTLGPVTGNTELTLQYGDGTGEDWFEALTILSSSDSLSRAQCKFVLEADTSVTFRTRISDFDSSSETITWLTPSANLIDTDLFNNGGNVLVYISSNGIEYSLEDTFVFTYEPIPEITDLSPTFIYTDEDTVITISGSNFQDNSANLVWIKSRSTEVSKVPTFISMTELQVTILQGEFPPRTRLELNATFNGVTYIVSPVYMSVAKKFRLQKLSQDYILSTADQILIYIEDDPEVAGGLWDTQNNLKWVYDNGSIVEQATYVTSTLVSCNLPLTSASSIDVAILIDEGTDFESTNTLTIGFIEAPTISSIDPLYMMFIPRETKLATVTGSGFLNSPTDKLYVYISGGQLIELEVTSDTEIEIPLPIMNPGAEFTHVYMSLDKNYFVSHELSTPGLITTWATGSYCITDTETACEAGEFCPENQIGKAYICGPGTTQTSSSQTSCDNCSSGKFWPFSAGVELNCPPGRLCPNVTNRIESELERCPDGFVCDETTTDFNITDDIGSIGRPKPCPDGMWCGPGVSKLEHVSGSTASPQICRNGTMWGQTIDGTTSTTLPGAVDSYGNYEWPILSFCNEGLPHLWPKGFKCSEPNLSEPEIWSGGFYSGEGQDECNHWVIGTICPYLGTTNPIKCSQGSVCQYSGQTGISKLCPAGSYWTIHTVTTRSNYSLIEEEYIPIYWYAGTYWLSGVYTPIVDSENPQAAQSCIEGSYWPEGTGSASGIPCPAGNYCPSNSTEPTPTDVGYFASGEGNVQQEPWPPGTYSNETEVSECQICPAGYECTTEATVIPTLCPEGTYKGEDVDLIFCESCPQGTWSNVTGLTSVSLCIDCEPRIVWIIEGMTSLDQAIDWPEGYVCPNYRTTSFTMFENPCPEGYYCGTRTALPEDYFLCDRGLYCPEASTSTGRTQNRCLTGYFWPLGTAASLNEFGTFAEVYQVSAARDLEGTDRYPTWDEDLSLPAELIEQYIDDGQQLKWPEGTTSSRGSWCLGHCQIPSTSTVVATYNPVNGSLTIDGEVNSFGEDTEYSGRMLEERDPLYNDLYRYVLKPLHTATLFIDFRDLPSGFNYNEHFKIAVHDEDGNELTLPNYFKADNSIASKTKELEIRIHNMKNQDQSFTFSIQLMHGLFSPYQTYLRNKVFVFLFHAERAKANSDRTYGFIISETFLSKITIPYNAPDVENDENFFLDMTARVGLLPSRNYDKDVYDTTYWQSRQITSAIMSWVPFFSNCEGYDNKLIFYDFLEENDECQLPSLSETKVVDPIPISGMTPVADKCSLEIACRYDEIIGTSSTGSERWFEVQESQTVFMITRDPIGPDKFFSKSGDDDSLETGFINAISDGSDSLIEAELIPQVSDGMPRNVTLQILYYQMTKTQKRIVKARIQLADYEIVTEQDDATYTLHVEFRAMTFFELINNFQFSVLIYILLFTMITITLFIGIIIVWIFNLLIARRKKPPVIKFMHMARVTFGPPTIGVSIASLTIAAVWFILSQGLTVFDTTAAEWKNQGEDLSEAEQIADKRGRLGLQFIIVGFVWLFYGANVLIVKPSRAREKEIVDQQKQERVMEQIDASIGESQSSFYRQKKRLEAEDDKEEDVKIRSALSWKRKHFLVMCMMITVGLLIKLEFSYTEIFSQNIYTFLVVFMIMDIILEQLLNRVILAETILVTPVIGAFVITEFVMTMGADDFYNFIVSYFIETSLVVAGRIYIGPAVERIEFYTQKFAIWLSLKFKFAEKMFRKTLRRQLLIQTQLQNLSEFHHFKRNSQKETGEGMEALLGSVVSYASQVQALFITPVVLLFIIFFAQETKIPQNYAIRTSDLNYYLIFSIILIFPQLVINIFLLHILEVLHGFKVYDYLTYCEFRFRNRTTKWINQQPLDKSILHSYRSLDNMSFSSQFYFIISLSTWGIILLDMGMITMIENQYNPFGDPVVVIYVLFITLAAVVLKLILSTIANYFSLWKISGQADALKLDTRAITVLDKEHDMRRLLGLIYNHHGFRHKFIRVNRAWVIENLAKVLTRDYVMKEDGENNNYFLLNVYQEAVNADAVEERLKKEQAKIQQDLAVMPYNMNKGDKEVVEVSDDSIGDIPVNTWHPRETLFTIPKVKQLALTWLDFARQNMNLKEMVVDIVMNKCASRCSRCKSTFRLQVIQEHPFSKIANDFRRDMSEIPFTKDLFRRYYNRHQEFTTLCMECAYIRSNNPDKADMLFKKNETKRFKI